MGRRLQGPLRLCLESGGKQILSLTLSLFTHTAPEVPDLSSTPSCYHHLGEVFNKTKATSLSPHRPYDCATDLIPAPHPKGSPVFGLWAQENSDEGIHQVFTESGPLIRPFSSPAGAGFLCFFVKKRVSLALH